MDAGYDLHPDIAQSSFYDSLSDCLLSHDGLDLSATGFPNKVLSMFMKSIKIFGYLEEPVFHEL
ncbi:hypothetical protein EV182_001825, partial [Spiromyces aspiralis]